MKGTPEVRCIQSFSPWRSCDQCIYIKYIVLKILSLLIISEWTWSSIFYFISDWWLFFVATEAVCTSTPGSQSVDANSSWQLGLYGSIEAARAVVRTLTPLPSWFPLPGCNPTSDFPSYKFTLAAWWGLSWVFWSATYRISVRIPGFLTSCKVTIRYCLFTPNIDLGIFFLLTAYKFWEKTANMEPERGVAWMKLNFRTKYSPVFRAFFKDGTVFFLL